MIEPVPFAPIVIVPTGVPVQEALSYTLYIAFLFTALMIGEFPINLDVPFSTFLSENVALGGVTGYVVMLIEPFAFPNTPLFTTTPSSPLDSILQCLQLPLVLCTYFLMSADVT